MKPRNSKELGYNVGDLFEILPIHPILRYGWGFVAGDIIELSFDDDSWNPEFLNKRTNLGEFITMESENGVPWIKRVRGVNKLDLI